MFEDILLLWDVATVDFGVLLCRFVVLLRHLFQVFLPLSTFCLYVSPIFLQKKHFRPCLLWSVVNCRLVCWVPSIRNGPIGLYENSGIVGACVLGLSRTHSNSLRVPIASRKVLGLVTVSSLLNLVAFSGIVCRAVDDLRRSLLFP
jgi:hypothetical protein